MSGVERLSLDSHLLQVPIEGVRQFLLDQFELDQVSAPPGRVVREHGGRHDDEGLVEYDAADRLELTAERVEDTILRIFDVGELRFDGEVDVDRAAREHVMHELQRVAALEREAPD